MDDKDLGAQAPPRPEGSISSATVPPLAAKPAPLPTPPVLTFDVDSVADEDLDGLLRDLKALSATSTLDYVPHAKQMAFHTSTKKIRFLCGGNQSGKTEAGVWEDVAHATGDYPDWYPAENRFRMANKGRVIVTDFGAGAGVFEEKLMHWLPKDKIVDIQRTVKGSIQKIMIRHKTGGVSQIEVMTHEQADNAFESWTGHWAHFDEPPPREKFVATRRGLIAYHGRLWLTLTPISEPWLYDEFIANDLPDVFFIVVDMRDNPHLSEAEVTSFEEGLTEDEKEARMHGRFKHLAGLVYKEFDPTVHIIPKARVKMNASWPTYFVTDPHDQKPHFGIWAKVDPFGTVYVTDEIKFKGTFKQYAHEVLMREMMSRELYGESMNVVRILDPNKGNTPSAVNGLTLVNEFANHGLYFTADVNDNIMTGHLAVSSRLGYNLKLPLSSTNHPKLYFVREATSECVRYIQRYTWSEHKGASKDEKGKKEKPMEKFKDFPDCVRYLIMSNPMYYDNTDSGNDASDNSNRGSTGY